MRQLKLQVQITVDGFVAAPGGGMEMFTWDWDDALKRHVDALTASVDTILLGRVLAEGFIPYWAGVAADAQHPEQASGRLFTDLPKVVFSGTLATSPWPGTRIARGALADEVNRLKREPGGDLIAYGGVRFVSALIGAGLVDEYHLFVNPVATGAGLRIFEGLCPLQRVRATAFDCGIVGLEYRPDRPAGGAHG